MVEKLRDKYAGRGVEFVGITDDEPAVASAWLARNHRTLRSLADPTRAVFDHYEVNAIPVVVVIGHGGTVVDYFEGLHRETALQEALERALR